MVKVVNPLIRTVAGKVALSTTNRIHKPVSRLPDESLINKKFRKTLSRNYNCC